MRDLWFLSVCRHRNSASWRSAVLLYWVANRRRIAAETVGRAEEQAVRTEDAERDAETRKKEAFLDAKERRTSSASRPSDRRAERQQISGLEQTLAEQTRGLAERSRRSRRPNRTFVRATGGRLGPRRLRTARAVRTARRRAAT